MVRQIKVVVLCLSLAGAIFGYMGAFTHWGMRHFDGIDAMKPFVVLVLSGIVGLAMIISLLYDLKRK